MPDPLMKTVSASQAAALWNASPYQTRWMLWNKFAHGLIGDEPETERMKWGKLIEPLVIEECAKKHNLEIIPGQKYYRRGMLGATRDATIIAPDRGPGTVEVKCIFDYSVWMSDWEGGKKPPRHHEIQLQTQMKVGDGDGTNPYSWGLLVAWVCADLHFYERRPIDALWTQLDIEAARFFGSIERKEEPDPFGSTAEIPWLTQMFETRRESILDLSAEHKHVKTVEELRLYAWHKAQSAGNHRAADEFRAKFMALARDYEAVILPCGYSFRIQRSGKGKTVVPVIPEVPSEPPPVPDSALFAG